MATFRLQFFLCLAKRQNPKGKHKVNHFKALKKVIAAFNPKFPSVHDLVKGQDGDTYYVFGTGNGIVLYACPVHCLAQPSDQNKALG